MNQNHAPDRAHRVGVYVSGVIRLTFYVGGAVFFWGQILF